MIRLLFIRHAEATEVGHGQPGLDERRQLTGTGRKEARALGRALKSLDIRPDAILTSPLVRAWETAEIVAAQIKKAPGLTETDVLAPSGKWPRMRKAVLDVIRNDVAADQTGKNLDLWVFAVGHQPNLSEMIAAALAGTQTEFRFDKGACVGLAWKSTALEGPPSICLALDMDSVDRVRRIS